MNFREKYTANQVTGQPKCRRPEDKGLLSVRGVRHLMAQGRIQTLALFFTYYYK